MKKEIEEEGEECYMNARNDIKKMGDPVDAITGMMKHVKMTSLELQKETNAWRGDRYNRQRKKWLAEEKIKNEK